jgi:hypothetical protein
VVFSFRDDKPFEENSISPIALKHLAKEFHYAQDKVHSYKKKQ